MDLYARSDMVLVAVPAESGGCGQSHARPVNGGSPAKLWKLDCPLCTIVLRGNPEWSQSALEIPLTPDEARVAKKLEEEGDRVMHQVSAALAKSSIETMRTAQSEEMETWKAAREKADLEARYEHAMAELARLGGLVSAMQEKAEQGPERASGDPAPRSVPDVAKATDVVTRKVSASCPGCGGPMRRPGAKGPTPKGLCLDCRKVKVS